ncbi:Uma2 family endonuclease [Sphingomonas sp.]|jgi:Uma2 family endonuclease|uniref:Uma2 family endonuclease n=1 Tax=Sphingomonas sp. TaxID=28214 RepID=UPI0035C873E1
MASRLSDSALLTAEQFLEIEFGPDIKAELDNGVIRMMAGGTITHSTIQGNFMRFLGNALRGSGCRPHASDAAVRTQAASVRYPDITVDCGASISDDKVLANPRMVVEILSPSTRRDDLGVKLDEYREIETVDTIVLVDPETERLRVLQRTGPGAWADRSFAEPADLELPSLGLVMPYDEIFSDD